MRPDPLNDALRVALSHRQQNNQLRTRRIVTPIDAVHVEIECRRYINFASNDYLGLTHHPRMLAAASIGSSETTGGTGSGAAGLISGYTPAHFTAEAQLADWKSTEAAVLLPSGYQANHAAVQTFAALAGGSHEGVRFLIDKLAHASLIDAVRATQLPMRIFPHNGLAKLHRLLEEAPPDQLQVVITESIFSMDGDGASLIELAALKEQHSFSLLLDEAHGAGVYGPEGAGYAAELGLATLADVTICTLSKAAGAIGGAVCASKLFCEALLNFGRAYIFSTSVPPATARMAQTAISIMRDEPQRQQRVRLLAKRVRERLRDGGMKISGGDAPPDDSPIVPVLIGEEQKTLAAARTLLAEGIYCVAVRPPTVARGASRLRVTLSSEHSDEEIDHLVSSLLRL